MPVKERIKALVFTVSLLIIGLVGNFSPLLFENAEAHTPNSPTCQQYDHDPVPGTITLPSLSHYESATEGCPICGSQAYVTWAIYNMYAHPITVTVHKKNGAQVGLCHNHLGAGIYVGQSVVLANVDCSNPNCGG